METDKSYGLYLYRKPTHNQKVLKDLLQFVKTVSPVKGNSFSYIEAETSLHPDLSLWENLQIELGLGNWNDFKDRLSQKQTALIGLVQNLDLRSGDAQQWEKFLISLLKGFLSSSQNLIVDMNEDLLNPFLMKGLKLALLEATHGKVVYLASASPSFWLDCAHTVVDRQGYKFEIQGLGPENIRKHWAA